MNKISKQINKKIIENIPKDVNLVTPEISFWSIIGAIRNEKTTKRNSEFKKNLSLYSLKNISNNVLIIFPKILRRTQHKEKLLIITHILQVIVPTNPIVNLE